MSLHSSEVQNLSPDQISSTYLNLRRRYNYFRFGKTNVRHIGTLLPVATSTISQLLAWHTILRQTTKFRPNWAYFRFRIWWCHSLPKVSVYQRTKFHQHILIHGWDITTSGLERQPLTILKFYFRFRFWPWWPYSALACHSALRCRISSKSVHPQRWYNVISIFKMAAASAQSYFRFQIGWRRSFLDVSFYQQTKVLVITQSAETISAFGKRMFAILEFYFRFQFRLYRRRDVTASSLERQPLTILKFYFRFRPYGRSRYVILHQPAKFCPNPNAHGRKITSCWF